MSKILVTPQVGTARMVSGVSLIGGTHYLVANLDDIEIRNLLTLNIIQKLEGVELKDKVTQQEFKELFSDVEKSKKMGAKETPLDYFANIARYVAEVLNSDKEPDSFEVDKKEPVKSSKAQKSLVEEKIETK